MLINMAPWMEGGVLKAKTGGWDDVLILIGKDFSML